METQYALTVLNGGEMTKLDELDQLFLSDVGDTSMAYDFKPTRLTAAAGGAKMFQDSDGNSIPAPLNGYIIDAVKTRAYWPVKDGNKIPFCSSIGAVHGQVNLSYTDADLAGAAQAVTPHPALIAIDQGREPASQYNCAGCPMAEFGSAYQDGGVSGGQACKAKVQLLVLPEGWFQPALLSVSTMSIKPWNAYASAVMQTNGRPFYAFKTAIGIDKKENQRGNPYGVLKFSKLAPIVDKQVAQAVLHLRRELKSYLYSRDRVVEDEDVVDSTGRVIDPDTGEVVG